MITIKHVLKDGTKVDSVEGHVIKAEDFPLLYEVMDRINRKDQKQNAVV